MNIDENRIILESGLDEYIYIYIYFFFYKFQERTNYRT